MRSAISGQSRTLGQLKRRGNKSPQGLVAGAPLGYFRPAFIEPVR